MINNYTYIIDQQENVDRYVATCCLHELLDNKSTSLTIVPTYTTCSVDLNCTVTQNGNEIPFNVEIKERNRTPEELKKYPLAELKQDKLRRMKLETPQSTGLYYMVLLNKEKCMLFNLKKLDWSEIPLKNWWIKRTQANPNSDYVCTPTYMIPYDKAIATINCSKYYN